MHYQRLTLTRFDPMKAWSDEWRCARLRLHLRDKQLFQGETVNIQVYADVMLSSDGSRARNDQLETATQLLRRWRDHCEGARVHIEIMEVSEKNPHANSSTPSSVTFFRQETQFLDVAVDHADGEAGAVVVLKAYFDLKVSHEFGDRPVLLIVHMTPKIGVAVAQGANGPGPLRDGLRNHVGVSLLRDERMSAQLISLTREEAQPTPLMTRRVEQRIVVTKPLQLEVEIRELTGRRVGVLARASNTHPTLVVAVRDLHIHLEQSLWASREMSRFRIVVGDKVLFPVVLQPQERYNFLFVLEPVEMMKPEELLRGPGDDKQTTAMATTLQEKVQSPVLGRRTVSTQQHTLVTLSWQAVAVSMDAITENRTIIWSPEAPSHSFSSLLSDENKPQTDFQKLVTYVLEGHLKQRKKTSADFKCVRLLPDSALQATIAPLASSILIGDAAKVCATVTNRSVRSNFDLTLVLPIQTKDGEGRSIGAAPVVVGFESSHRMGLVRPGTSVRQLLHVTFLRLGKCRLGPLVLVDHLSSTCFISDDWEIFVRT